MPLPGGAEELGKHRLTRRKPLQTAAYTVQYILLTTVIFFPLTVYQGFFREHQYDLATQNFGEWMRDQLVGLGVNLVLMSLLLAVLYGVFSRSPRNWWLWGTGVSVAFLVLLILIAPVYLDPLFNTYEPLADERVKGDVLSMARASGMEVNDVFQFDASRQTNRISANVSGFLGAMRIRLNDNLLNRCSREEVKAVMGHEIGHYVLNHVYESILFIGVLLAGGFAFVSWGPHRDGDELEGGAPGHRPLSTAQDSTAVGPRGSDETAPGKRRAREPPMRSVPTGSGGWWQTRSVSLD